MSQLHGPRGLAEVLGLRDRSVRWERALAFGAALVISDLISASVAMCLAEPNHFRWGPMLLWDLTFACLAVASYLLFFFFLLRREWVAVVVSAIALAVPIAPVDWIVFSRPPFLMATVMINHTPWIQLYRFLWVSLWLLGLSLALRRVRPLWLALAAGPGAGMLVVQGLWIVAAFVAPESRSWFSFEPHIASLASVLDRTVVAAVQSPEPINLVHELTSMLLNLLFAAVFGVVLWAGLRLAEAKETSPREPSFAEE